MNIELKERFRKFDEDVRKQITVAVSRQAFAGLYGMDYLNKRGISSFADEIKGLPPEVLEWLVNWEESLIGEGTSDG